MFQALVNGGKVVLESGHPTDLPAVIALLSSNGLPSADVKSHIGEFILAKLGEDLVGTIAAEYYGKIALLRSLCVAESQRGKGTGHALVSALEVIMINRGAREVYLLTTTAARFFERKGFVEIPRGEAPIEIRQTSEFCSLCPATAVIQRKILTNISH